MKNSTVRRDISSCPVDVESALGNRLYCGTPQAIKVIASAIRSSFFPTALVEMKILVSSDGRKRRERSEDGSGQDPKVEASRNMWGFI